MTIPGHKMGTPLGSCQNCYHFSFNRKNLPEFDQGVDIIGRCELHNEYTSAHKLCQNHTEGEPDAH